MEVTGQQIGYRRITEWIVTILTIGLVVLTITTYTLDQNKNNWICGPVLLLIEFFAIGFQSVLTFIVWKSDKQKTKTIVTIISIGLLTFIIWCFINFITKCS
jgi:uncharacterized membrane protein